MKKIVFSAVTYKNEDLHKKVKEQANKKFGDKNSYVKNLWILKRYKDQGGEVSYNNTKKPSTDKIKKNINASSIQPFLEIDDIDMYFDGFPKIKLSNLTENPDNILEVYAGIGTNMEELVSDEAVTEEDLNDVYRYVSDRLRYMEDLLNRHLDTLWKAWADHHQGHLPPIKSVEQLENALKALGLEKEYTITKRAVSV